MCLGNIPSTLWTGAKQGILRIDRMKCVSSGHVCQAPLILRYFCCYMACHVSYKTIKVYLAGICLGHIERGFEDPTKDELLYLLCTGIKRSQGVSSCTRLPITITVLQTLKSQLSLDPSFSPLEKRLLWAAFTLAFYGFLRANEFATPNLT